MEKRDEPGHLEFEGGKTYLFSVLQLELANVGQNNLERRERLGIICLDSRPCDIYFIRVGSASKTHDVFTPTHGHE